MQISCGAFAQLGDELPELEFVRDHNRFRILMTNQRLYRQGPQLANLLSGCLALNSFALVDADDRGWASLQRVQ